MLDASHNNYKYMKRDAKCNTVVRIGRGRN